jgi:hypothetical protein
VIIIVSTGSSTYVKYSYESTFKTAVAANKVFGVKQKMTRSSKNNIQRLFSLGQRYASNLVSTAYDGTISMEFQLSNPWFLRGIFGNAPFHVAGTPDLFYFVDTENVNASAAINLANNIPSLTIENWIDMESIASADPKSTFVGCVVDGATISASQGEVVSVSLDMLYADESYNRSAAYAQPATVTDSYDPFIFADGTLKIDSSANGTGGTVIANVTNVELSFRNNMELLKALGLRAASAKVAKQFECDIKMSVLFDLTRDLLEKFLGNTTDATFNTIPRAGAIETTLNLTFDNGLSGDSQRSIIFNITNVKIEESSFSLAVEDPITQEISALGAKITLVLAKNAETSEP